MYVCMYGRAACVTVCTSGLLMSADSGGFTGYYGLLHHVAVDQATAYLRPSAQCCSFSVAASTITVQQ
jgi:hypothetical protein